MSCFHIVRVQPALLKQAQFVRHVNDTTFGADCRVNSGGRNMNQWKRLILECVGHASAPERLKNNPK